MKEKSDHGTYMESVWSLVLIVSCVAMLPAYGQSAVMMSSFAVPSIRKGISTIQSMMKVAKSRVAERKRHIKEGKLTRQDTLAKLLTIHQERGEKENFILEDVETEAYTAMRAFPPPFPIQSTY